MTVPLAASVSARASRMRMEVTRYLATRLLATLRLSAATSALASALASASRVFGNLPRITRAVSGLVIDSGANNNAAGGLGPGRGVETSSGVQSLGRRVPDADRGGPNWICCVSVASRHVARRGRPEQRAAASAGGGAEDKPLKAAAAADADPLLLLAASIALRPTPRLASTPGLQYILSRPRAACATGRKSPITLPAGGAPGLLTRLPVEQ